MGNDFFKTSIATALNLTNSIVIDNLDSWLGNSVLREKYRAGTGLAHDKHEIKIAKIQAIEQGKAMAETQFKLQQEVKRQE